MKCLKMAYLTINKIVNINKKKEYGYILTFPCAYQRNIRTDLSSSAQRIEWQDESYLIDAW